MPARAAPRGRLRDDGAGASSRAGSSPSALVAMSLGASVRLRRKELHKEDPTRAGPSLGRVMKTATWH
eukprot:1960658-Prymnesium_polylepis.1